MSWKRFNYLVHRWIGIVLGVVMLVWFASGIAMMYYPYPEFTSQERLAALQPLALNRNDSLIDFAAARDALSRGMPASAPATRARVLRWDDRVVYALYAEHGPRLEGLGLVDARDGTLLTPLSAEQATQIARASQRLSGNATAVLLARGDHYFMGSEKRGDFPVYRVTFDDADRTAVYVSARTGETVARVDSRARLTTWIGTVPHWLYFQSLYYDHSDAWLWINIVLPAVAMAIAITGMVLGVVQLFPHRRRRAWKLSGYHGVSKWHHLAGVLGGALVFTWTLSGMLEVLGPSATPSGVVFARARGDTVVWSRPTLSASHAAQRVLATTPGDSLAAIDLVRADGRAGYLVLLRSGGRVWVDAMTGAVRREIDRHDAERVARDLLGRPARVAAVERRSEADAFYYATHGRDLRLPVWRVSFADEAQTTVYLDPVTALPTALVDDAVRRWRWWREGLHDFDFPVLANKRPLWDAVVLPLMLVGLVSCVTGIWLLGRRLWRLRPAPARQDAR